MLSSASVKSDDVEKWRQDKNINKIKTKLKKNEASFIKNNEESRRKRNQEEDDIPSTMTSCVAEAVAGLIMVLSV